MTLHSGNVNVDTVEVDPVFGTSGSFLTVTLTVGSGGGGGGGAVDSVNGLVGVVVLDAGDVGADPAGTASTDVAAHAALPDPHPGYLTPAEGNAAYDALGAAAAAQAAAEATAAADVATHSADTTSVHGIADTSALVLTGDSRLSDARTPTAHAASHQDGGSDELALDGSQVTSGTVADARIASTIARDSEVAAGYQPLDTDLTTIAALDSTTAGALVTDGSGWFRKTYAQLKTALALVKADVGLGSVDNTSDAGKPVSTAQQTALDLKANLASPALTGTPTLPTAAGGTNTTQAASTAFTTAAVAAEATARGTSEALLAPLASPALTGNPTAPTQTAGNNSTRLATTAFVAAATAGGGSSVGSTLYLAAIYS